MSNCITYFAVILKNQDSGIVNKEEVNMYIKNTFGITPKWNKNHFMVGYNEEERSELNKSIRDTIKDLIGKEKHIKEMCKKYGVSTSLIVRLKITKNVEEQNQTIKLDNDIIDFLYKSNTAMDLDY